jgi:hypothetical protein
MTADRRLVSLALGHIALAVVCGLCAPIEINSPLGLDHLLVVPFFAAALCQAFMLGFWDANSSVSRWARVVGGVVGAVFLEILFSYALKGEFFGMITTTIVVTAVVLSAVRSVGVRLTRQDEPSKSARAEPDGLRFSIRSLMVLTAVVALLSAGARNLQDVAHDRFLLMVIWALCFVTVGLAALWAALGSARPLRREPVVIGLSLVLGTFFAFAARAHQAGWVYIALTMLLYPSLLLGTLLVVRSRGYRLVRREDASSYLIDLTRLRRN